MTRLLKPALTAGAALWCLAIVAAPLLHSATIYTFFSIVCHQLPGRSWHIDGEPLGVCIRCTAISLGFFFGMVGLRPSPLWFKWALGISAGQWLLAVMVVDSVTLRICSGVLLGATAAPIVRAGVLEMLTYKLGTAHESM